MEGNNFHKLEGVIFRIDEVVEFSRFFSKQEFILLVQRTYQDKIYEDYIKFECINDKIYVLTGRQEGNRVLVSFVIQGREGKKGDAKGRFYNSLRAMDIDLLDSSTAKERAAEIRISSEKKEIDAFVGTEEADTHDDQPDNELPF
jgi:single-strand DNA-binding protein